MPPRVRPGRTHGRANTPRPEIQAGADLSPRQPALRRSHKFTALTEFCKRLSGHGKPSDLRKLFLAANDTTEDDLLVTGVPFATIIDLKENYGVRTFTAI